MLLVFTLACSDDEFYVEIWSRGLKTIIVYRVVCGQPQLRTYALSRYQPLISPNSPKGGDCFDRQDLVAARYATYRYFYIFAVYGVGTASCWQDLTYIKVKYIKVRELASTLPEFPSFVGHVDEAWQRIRRAKWIWVQYHNKRLVRRWAGYIFTQMLLIAPLTEHILTE